LYVAIPILDEHLRSARKGTPREGCAERDVVVAFRVWEGTTEGNLLVIGESEGGLHCVSASIQYRVLSSRGRCVQHPFTQWELPQGPTPLGAGDELDAPPNTLNHHHTTFARPHILTYNTTFHSLIGTLHTTHHIPTPHTTHCLTPIERHLLHSSPLFHLTMHTT